VTTSVLPPPDADPATVAPARSGAAPGSPSDLAVGSLVALGLFALLLIRQRWIIGSPVLLGGDEAHQFATAGDAISFRELRGNGSRLGFNHPGPSYLWIWGAADVLRRATGSFVGQHNVMVGATLALNAAQLGALTAIVRSHLRSIPRALIVLVAIVLGSSVVPYILVGTWLPEMFACSFALLVVAGASAAAGRLPSLVAYAAAAGLLLQGHVVFSSFVGLGTLVLLVVMWRTGDLARLWREARPTLVATGALAIAFAAPVVGYTLLDWPGELAEYAEYSQRPESGGHPVDAAVRFVLEFWPGGSGWVQLAVAAASFAALAGVSWWRRSRFGGTVLVATLLTEFGLLVYVLTGLDDIRALYVAIWMAVVPGIVIGTATALALTDRVVEPDSRPARAAVASVVVGGLVAAVLLSPSTATGGTRELRFDAVFGLVDRLETEVGERTLVLDVTPENIETYSFVGALASVALDRGVDLCFVQEEWRVKFTEERVCTPGDLRDGARYALYPASGGTPKGVDPTTLRQVTTVLVVPGALVTQPPG
jgi:hypothetical protein